MSDKQTDKNTIGKGKPGPGRKKGVPNVATRDLREMILVALEKAGGAEYLYEQSLSNPNAFLSLVGKCLPKDIKAELVATHIIQKLAPEQLTGIIEGALVKHG
jgi:hypothetical protein